MNSSDKDKIRQETRKALNEWLKKQTRFQDYKGKLGGYLITKSQVEKLKKILWRLEYEL